MNSTADRLRIIERAYGTRTRAELALLCDVSTVTLWRWVSGRTQPDRHEAARLEMLEATGPTEGIGSASSGRATAGAAQAAPQVSPPTISGKPARSTGRGVARGASPSAPRPIEED